MRSIHQKDYSQIAVRSIKKNSTFIMTDIFYRLRLACTITNHIYA